MDLSDRDSENLQRIADALDPPTYVDATPPQKLFEPIGRAEIPAILLRAVLWIVIIVVCLGLLARLR
jgi:hypothetical protein